MIRYTLGTISSLMEDRAVQFEKSKLLKRIYAKDETVWKSEPGKRQAIIDRLGWLNIVEWMLPRIPEIQDFVAGVRKDKITDVVLLGMGGSSLCPEVLHSIFGIAKGCPKFYMLDSTDPAVVLQIEKKIKLASSLFIVSSKSGGTVETKSQFRYFLDKLSHLKQNNSGTGKHFVAITDQGTSLQKLAVEKQFRKIFVNPSDIGGRYSALSYFGVVPAALMGINITKLLDNALAMKQEIYDTQDLVNNPGIYPGLVLGELALAGRDKATFLIPEKLAPMGYWIEQLIAESTGKENKGVIPIEGEQIASPGNYGKDRVFIVIQLKKETKPAFTKKIEALKKAEFPVIEILLKDKYDIAGEFYRWEISTAMMGAVLKIDPFDQPNVQSAKDITKKILETFKAKGKFEEEAPLWKSKAIQLYNSDDNLMKAIKPKAKLEDVLYAFLKEKKETDYISILGFLPKSKPIQQSFNRWRKFIQENIKLSTTQGYGPRYLHSIGQLYKGGQNSGIFFLFTIIDTKDLAIPNEVYSFSQLKHAQALGDYQALKSTGRRVIRIALSKDYTKDLETFGNALAKATLKIKKETNA